MPVDTLLTDVITLDDINEGFDRLDRGEATTCSENADLKQKFEVAQRQLTIVADKDY